MSIAERIRLDELCQQVSDLTARVRALEAKDAVAAMAPHVPVAIEFTPTPDDPKPRGSYGRLVVGDTNAAIEGDDPEPAKRRPGRPRKEQAE